MSQQHAALLKALTHLIVETCPARIVRVCIDGVDGAGKTTLADHLASAVSGAGRPAIRASIDDFHNARSIRYARGRSSPVGFYRDSYNYAAFRALLLDPLSPGGSRLFTAKAFDHRRDAPVELPPVEASQDAVLIVDGIFLHRAELASCWDLSIFLAVDFGVSIPRGAQRGPDFGSPDVHALSNRRYIEGQKLYLAEASPATQADVVVDYNDCSQPRILKWPP